MTIPRNLRDALSRELSVGLVMTGPNYDNVPVNLCPDDDPPGEPRPMKVVPVNDLTPFVDFLLERGWTHPDYARLPNATTNEGENE